MKKKISAAFVFAMILVLLSAAALAATLLLSPRASASRVADRALEEKYGITAEMQSFFSRKEEVLENGTVKVTYTGIGDLEYVLGAYTAVVRDGKAEFTWSHDGEDTSGGYEAEAWGLEQLRQMTADSADEQAVRAYLRRAAETAKRHNLVADDSSSAPEEGWLETMEARKTAAMKARRIPEEEMIRIGREFIVSTYGLNEEQTGRMELYTGVNLPGEEGTEGNGWYDMINDKPCFIVEYLLGQPEVPEAEGVAVTPLPRGEMDGYYVVYVNVETGEIESYEYNSGLGGLG